MACEPVEMSERTMMLVRDGHRLDVDALNEIEAVWCMGSSVIIPALIREIRALWTMDADSAYTIGLLSEENSAYRAALRHIRETTCIRTEDGDQGHTRCAGAACPGWVAACALAGEPWQEPSDDQPGGAASSVGQSVGREDGDS